MVNATPWKRFVAAERQQIFKNFRREYLRYHVAYSKLARYYNTLASRTNLFGEIELPSSKGLSFFHTTQLDFVFC